MKCPRTQVELKPVIIDGITIDLSESCGGVFFDNYELKKFDEVHEKGGEDIIKLMKNHTDPQLDTAPRIHCPKCENIVMARHFYSPEKAIEIDRCPNCGGVWMDPGELEKVRELFPTEEDRNKVSEKLVNETYKTAGFDEILAESEEKAKTARRFANMFRFLCPSKAIPGKQDGAAF